MSESTLVKMPHCWKSHVTAHILCRGKVCCSDMDQKRVKNQALDKIV